MSTAETSHNDGDPREGPSGRQRDASTRAHEGGGLERGDVVEREKQAYGGIKMGSAFFGWLTATAASVLLTALVAAAGAAIGVSTNADVGAAAAQASADPQAVGLTGGIILLVILFIAYYCGGYVAGRMARFNGVRQGLAVWLWAVVIAVVVAVLAVAAGSKYDVLSKLNSFPRIPVTGANLTTGGTIALLVVAIAALAGALLGGLAGMRFHRNVDRAGLGDPGPRTPDQRTTRHHES